MKVNLIDYTGADSKDPLYAAKLLCFTKNTRLQQDVDLRHEIDHWWSDDKINEELEYISKTIRSSWEFVDYTFQITGVSRAFTHQFVRTRTISFAQQSQRSVAMDNFDTVKPDSILEDVDASLLWTETMSEIQSNYNNLIRLGISPQDARGILPTNIQTNIIAKMNLRTLADLAAKRINSRAQGEYSLVCQEMTSCVLSIHPWTEPFLFPERKRTPFLNDILTELLGASSPVDKPRVNAALKELDGLKATWG